MKDVLSKVSLRWVWRVGLLCVVVVGAVTWQRWLPATRSWVDRTSVSFRDSGERPEADETDPRAGQDHDAGAGHDPAKSLELSDQAIRNLGLSAETIRPVQLETFRRSITVPAVVVERPGRSRVQVATPMTGVVTHIHAVQGEAVEPGTLLFQIRLTHEDLVQAQTDFVRSLGELDVEQREIARLQRVTSSGAIAGKVLLERQYARDRLNASLGAQRESLRLHGLSEKQVQQIESERRLLSELQIYAPTIDSHGESHGDEELRLTQNIVQVGFVTQSTPEPSGPLILQDLLVHKGQSLNAGETLCILTDYDELFIEGLAFEQDIRQLRTTSQNGWNVDAIWDQPGAESLVTEGLEIAYLANQIDVQSRTLNFYVRLPNDIAKDHRADGNRYVEWRYVPGQRLQLRVPVQEIPEQIVLPVEALAHEGAEYFVFQQNGNHFDRVPVHVTYRDQHRIVIDNDGSLFPGDVIAMRGAYQMQMALKNQSGGAVDPHAGHNH